jgi:hypothetical protein
MNLNDCIINYYKNYKTTKQTIQTNKQVDKEQKKSIKI